MVEQKFNNVYDVILCTLSVQLDRIEREDQLSAVECIWWLASIIQFMERLVYCRHYKIFPSDYIINCKVLQLPSILSEGSLIPQSDIPVVDINNDPDSEVCSSQWKLPPKCWNEKQEKLNMTHSGKVFKNSKYQEPSIQQMQARFGKQSKKQQSRTRELFRSGELIIDRDYA